MIHLLGVMSCSLEYTQFEIPSVHWMFIGNLSVSNFSVHLHDHLAEHFGKNWGCHHLGQGPSFNHCRI